MAHRPGRRLPAVTSTNQDNCCMQGVAEVEGKPVIGLDVWEHAYYLGTNCA